MASSDNSRKDGRGLLGGEDFVPLSLALAGRHVHRWSPKDEEDVLHSEETAGAPVTPIPFGLVLLRGDSTIVLLEHVVLLKGVIDWGLVVQTRLL
jgi:hypothetical protein